MAGRKQSEKKAAPPRPCGQRLLLAGMGAALAAIALASLLLGRFSISPAQCVGILASKLFPVQPYWTQVQDNMVTLVRLPRVCLALLVGGALAVAGAAYQCIFRNPLAAPDVLGASTGAAFGAALAILLHQSSGVVTAWAFGGSLACVGLVVLCSKLCRGSPVLNLVLSGIMVGALFSAATSYLKLIADPHDTLPAITYWMMGSLSGASLSQVGTVLWPMALGFVPLLLLRWRMNLLTLDDAEARTMGVNTRRTRLVVILCATLLTASSVAVSGMVGWVGLVIPNLMRRVVGSDCRVLVPASALVGASFLLVVDDVARSLYTTELPLGILTAFIGAPFFLYLLSRREEW